MNIITGYRGEPHITAQEDRDINLGVVGKSTSDLYVLDVGQQLDADIVSANEIRIRDGVLVMQGCAASIDYGTYDSLTISNGSQGMERIDVIAAQYERDGDTNVESVSLVVIEGTPAASDPVAPTLTGGSIQGGDTLVQMPLYYVNLDGVSIDSIDAQFTMVDSAFTNSITEATKTKWATATGNDGSINDALDYTATKLPVIGDVIIGEWTKSGTVAQNDVQLTEEINLPKGTYIIVVKTPIQNTYSTVRVTNIPNSYFYLQSNNIGVVVYTFAADTPIMVKTAGSASCTYSYLERGGLTAIRIA